ncbi:MAG: hypothetical protein IJO43_02315 [Bacilli bacterium]|nr:hypothetical protein [Bacilli bacterium]
MEKNNKESKFQFKELFTNKQYRSIMILALYAILFAVLIVIIRNPVNVVSGGGSIKSKVDGYELIDNKNFGYKYTVTLDEDTYVYEGQKYNNKDLFTLSKGEESVSYYIEGDKFYKEEDGVYKSIIDKPIIVFDYFNTNILDQLIIRSVLIDEKANKYKIDNQSLYDVLNEDSSKVESGENYITLGYRNSNITKIEFELGNYARLVGDNYDKVIISLEYYDFNLIEDFTELTVE